MSGVQSLARMARGLRRSPPAQPQLSLVLIVYDMPEQAANTIRSLLPGYQRDVSASEYELIVVENASANTLHPEFLQSLPANVHYHLRQSPEPSPAQAINFGASHARGKAIAIMIDGARMVTPGLVCNLLLAHRSFPGAVVSIPGYHLGRELQQTAVGSGYDRATERALLASIAWPVEGYRLFEIACFSGSCSPGFFLPNSESNCISVTPDLWQALGGFDPRFDLPGGGLINLDFYKRACEHPGVQHVIVPGEGTFHQFHGGVTTGGVSSEMRADYIERSRNQYRVLRGSDFSSPRTRPAYLGEIPVQAQRFVHYSAARALRSQGEAPLPENPARGGHVTSTLYFPPSLQRFEPRRMVFSTWVDHLPFAYDLVTAIRPQLVVELGVYNGLSFFTFCQAMVENDIDGVAYAIDCWEGDEHTDAYDDSIFNEVQQHAREHYRGISYLLRMYFNEALRHFEEDSIELLHIDGLHTYEAVKEDFDNWYPKVKPGGIVLFHDVMARIKDFGAWKFFAELEQQHDEIFKFNHGFGLGMLRKPGGNPPDTELTELLFSRDEETHKRLRQLYSHAAHFLEARRQAKRFKPKAHAEADKGGQGKQAGEG